MKSLVDQSGRHIHKLRLGLLDACNFRCLYCMPDNPVFMPKKNWMKREEIFRLASVLNGLGIDEIRLTGGEPTLRSDFVDIAEDISTLPLKKLGITSNGVTLAPHLKRLQQTNLKYINLSLDSLNREKFKELTKMDALEEVLKCIFTAKELGFSVKINTVLMKGYNDDEIHRFVDFSREYDIEIRFLELMKIGVARSFFEKRFAPIDVAIDAVTSRFGTTDVILPKDSTSFAYDIEGGGRIGFIASESRPFCHSCSRLRLGPDGCIRPCLMLDSGFSLVGKNESEIESLLHKTMALKPVDRIESVAQAMYQIGG
ncbi:MAG: GTP 3',8-cyclase MoaA [Bacteriovoracaceae bacterium]|mgnify:CR=1 FL=1|nr:GTP 3',8-cyclase MoaA [Bacteriovoracaceae bacterium]